MPRSGYFSRKHIASLGRKWKRVGLTAVTFLVIHIFFSCFRWHKLSFLPCSGHESTPQTAIHVSYSTSSRGSLRFRTFKEAIQDRVERGGFLILAAMVDKGYLRLAKNFFKTSIEPFGLTNKVLFLCVEEKSCDEAIAFGMPAFMFANISNSDAGLYNSDIFDSKSKLKLKAVYEVLLLGRSVLLTDTDVAFFRSPERYVTSTCQRGCDIMIGTDGSSASINSGFYYVRPSNTTIRYFLDLTKDNATKGNDQKVMNVLLRGGKYNKTMNFTLLPASLFPDGKTYFELGNRSFAGQNRCADCFMVHNNWIVSVGAKEYRLKEHKLWGLDEDGYYTNPRAKYLTYGNPIVNSGSTWRDERQALVNAIAIAVSTNRTLVLPRFHLGGREVPLNHVMLLQPIMKRFGSMLRESVFLENSLVPDAIKKSTCGPLVVRNAFTKTKRWRNVFRQMKVNSTVRLYPADVKRGASWEELLRWTEPYYTCRVLIFHSLYGKFADDILSPVINDVDNVFQNATERQLEMIYLMP